MGFLLTILYTILFIFLIYKLKFFQNSCLKPKVISGIFLLKIFFGLMLWAVYAWHYGDRNTSDSFKYFDDASFIYNALFINPVHYLQMVTGFHADDPELMSYYENMKSWFKKYDYGLYNDNRTVIRFNALAYLFSFGFYPVHIVIWCFISLTGLMAVFKSVYPMLKDKGKELIVAVFLLPSVLFWGSGVLKEGILLFAFGLAIYHFNKLINNKYNLKTIAWTLASFSLLVFTKGYVVLALLPGLLSLIIVKITGNKYTGWKFFLTHLVLLFIVLNLYRINQEYDMLFYLYQKQKDFINLSGITEAKSFIETRIFEPSWKSLFLNGPEALFNVLARPLIFESSGLLILAAAAENLILLTIGLLSLIFFKKPERSQLPLLFFSIFFVISLSLIIGYVTPVIGAIVRYKIPMLPFFLIIFIIIADKEKIIKKLPFLIRKK